MSAVRRLLLALPVLAAAVPAFGQGDAPRLPNPLASIARDSVHAFVERPLFEPARRPPVVAAPPIGLPPPPRIEAPPMLRLIGVVEGEGSLAAIVHRLDTDRTETLHSGDRIGGWTVEVMPGTLRVASGDRAFDYAMFRGNLQQGPAAVGPSAAPPMPPAPVATAPR